MYLVFVGKWTLQVVQNIFHEFCNSPKIEKTATYIVIFEKTRVQYQAIFDRNNQKKLACVSRLPGKTDTMDRATYIFHGFCNSPNIEKHSKLQL